MRTRLLSAAIGVTAIVTAMFTAGPGAEMAAAAPPCDTGLDAVAYAGEWSAVGVDSLLLTFVPTSMEGGTVNASEQLQADPLPSRAFTGNGSWTVNQNSVLQTFVTSGFDAGGGGGGTFRDVEYRVDEVECDLLGLPTALTVHSDLDGANYQLTRFGGAFAG